jgi:hypothetical protein
VPKFEVKIKGFGWESCSIAKQQRAKEKEAKDKRRSKFEDENLIHKQFLKSSNSYKQRE